MIVAVPNLTPVTIPVKEPTVAIEGLLLLHTPSVDPPTSVIAVVAPAHTFVLPVKLPATGVEQSV